MKKDRGIGQLDNYLGNLSDEIGKKIKQKGKVRVLDAGCGYGLAMAGLIKKFGNKIEVIGYNQKRAHGTIKDFKERAIHTGIFTKNEIKRLKNIPKIVYFDADKGLPFKTNSFDFVFSLASIYLYKDKIKFFEECNRVLKQNGIAKIQLFETAISGKKQEIIEKNKYSGQMHFWEIWESGKEINFVDYFKLIKNIRIGVGKREDNNHSIIYLEIRKSSKLDFKLKLIDFIDMRLIAQDRFGLRSIYITKEKSV